MAEFNSRQAAKIALGKKLSNSESGRSRKVLLQTQAVFAAIAIADTVAGGSVIPAGSRLSGCKVSNGAGNASCTVNIGLRKRSDGTVISATAIASAVALTTATTIPVEVGNGTYIAAGIDQVLADDAEPYLTVAGAAIAANQQIKFEIDYIGA